MQWHTVHYPRQHLRGITASLLALSCFFKADGFHKNLIPCSWDPQVAIHVLCCACHPVRQGMRKAMGELHKQVGNDIAAYWLPGCVSVPFKNFTTHRHKQSRSNLTLHIGSMHVKYFCGCTALVLKGHRALLQLHNCWTTILGIECKCVKSSSLGMLISYKTLLLPFCSPWCMDQWKACQNKHPHAQNKGNIGQIWGLTERADSM